METLKVRITAKEKVERRFAIIFMNVKIAVAFDRDSGARVGHSARLICGNIGSGGSRVNWYCYAAAGTIFELEVDKEFFETNKNRIKKWDIEVIPDFTVTKARADAAIAVQQNLE
jgi:hypothetical protein